MKISGVDIRPGNILEYEGGIWKVAKIQHTQPGKGGAYMQVEMKNLQDGRKTNVRFRSADTVERVRLDTKDFQYLYADGDMLVFMDQDTYETVTLAPTIVGDDRQLLVDNVVVQIQKFNGNPIGIQLPPHVELTVTSAEPGVRGDTASGGVTKLATLETGLEIRVPLFIKEGERVKVHTETREFAGRA